MKANRFIAFLTITLMCLTLTSCGEKEYQVQDTTAVEAQKLLFSDLARWDEAVSATWREQNLAQILPNTKAWVDDGREEPRQLSELAVIGEVVSIKPGRAFEPSDATGADTEHPFDFRPASYRTLEATVSVSKAWGTSGPLEGVTLTVPIRSDVDPKIAMDALESLGTVVVVLENQGFYGYAPQSWRIARNNALIGVVEESGALKFPALSEDADYFDGVRTLEEFTQAADRPEETVDLRSKN